MGWNEVVFRRGNGLTEQAGEKLSYYFAHSYYTPVGPATSAVTECGITFSAAIRVENFYGVQFHPEKSGAEGLKLLESFCKLCD